jgi:rhodanese-related sulfurtransferase
MSKKNTSKTPEKKTFPLWGWVFLAALLLGVTACAAPQKVAATATPLSPEVTVVQASKMRDQGAFILDVREPSEWEQFHIPGATLIPLGQLPDRLNEVPKDHPVVVVCRTGHRSASGRDILLGAGFPQVTSIAGGMTEWQAQGLPIATGK